MDNINYLYKDGDFIIISLVPLSYPTYQTAHLMIVESIVYAIDDANKNLMKTTNHKEDQHSSPASLGYFIYDTEDVYLFETLTKILLRVALGSSMLHDFFLEDQSGCLYPPLLTNRPIIGFIGSETSHSTDFLSSFTSFTDLPIISYWATSIEFNDRQLYPRVFRTISDDGQLALTLIEVLKKLGISFVSIISTDEQYGRSGRQELLRYLKDASICVDIDVQIQLPMKATIPKNIIRNAVERENHLQGRRQTFIIFTWSDITTAILEQASIQRFHNATWLLGSFDGITNGELIDPEVMNGAITAVADSGVYEDFYGHFWGHLSSGTPHILPSWTYKYENEMGVKPIIEQVNDMTTRYYLAGYVRNAVFAYGTSIKNYIIDRRNCTDEGCSTNNKEQFNISDYFENYVNNLTFKGIHGESISFDNNGALNYPHFRVYDIFRGDTRSMIQFREVAKMEEGTLTYKDNQTHWISKDIRDNNHHKSTCSRTCGPGKMPFMNIGPLCCWLCQRCEDGFAKANSGLEQCTRCPSGFSDLDRRTCLIFRKVKMSDYRIVYIVFLSIAVAGVCLSMFMLLLIIGYRTEKFVKAMDIQKSLFQIHVQLVLFLLTIYLNVTEVSDVSCHVYYFGLSPLFTMVFSFMLAKSERLLSIFNAKTRFSKREVMVNTSKTYLLIMITISVDVLITSVVYMGNHKRIIEIRYTPHDLREEVYCIGDDLIYVKSVYLFLILLMSSIQAFRSRNLPSRYNESRSLLFINACSFVSMLLFGIARGYDIFKGMEKMVYLSLSISITNINILVFTFYLKFVKHLFHGIQKRRKRSKQMMNGGDGVFLRSYSLEWNKAKAALQIQIALKEISGRSNIDFIDDNNNSSVVVEVDSL